MIKALYDYLKEHSSINQVYPRGMNIGNPARPYLVIWEDSASLNDMDNGSTLVFVSCHVPSDDFALLDNFIVHELFELLDRKVIPDGDHQFEVYVTGDMSPIVPPKGNDDGTLSRDRMLEIPTRWR